MVSIEADMQQHRYWPLWRLTLIGLNLLALVLSVILSWHYLKGGAMIGCSGGSPCEQVLNSRWSTIAGVLPVTGLAMGIYLAMLVATFFISSNTEYQIRKLAWNVLLVLAGAVAGSAIWFIIVQKWFIGSFCLYCMTEHITGLLLAVLIIRQASFHKKFDEDPSKNFTNVQSISIAKSSVLSMRIVGFILIGVFMSGMLAASQIVFAPKSIYQNGEAQNRLTEIDYEAAPIIGSPDAPHVVKLLFDYNCPHCQKIHFMLDEAVHRYGGKLAFVLCPSPLNTGCNPYIPRDVDAFKNSCELAKIGLKVWAAKREAYPAFENWMFRFESGDKWQPRSVESARAKAIELIGQEKFNDTVGNDWVEKYLQICVQIYGQTLKSGKGGIPKLVYGSQWVIPEPNNEDDLLMILQKSLALPKP